MSDKLFNKRPDGSIVPSPGWDVFRDIESFEGETWYVSRIYQENGSFYITMFDFVANDLKNPRPSDPLRVMVKNGVVICINESLFEDSPWGRVTRLSPKPNGLEFSDPIQDEKIPLGDIVKVDVAIVDPNDFAVSLIRDAQTIEHNMFEQLDESADPLEVLSDIQNRISAETAAIKAETAQREIATDQIGRMLHELANSEAELTI